MPRIYPSRSYGVNNESNRFQANAGLGLDSSKTQLLTWTDQVASRVATGPNSSSYPAYNLLGPGYGRGWMFAGQFSCMNLDSGFLSQFVNLPGITFTMRMKPGEYPSGSAETYAFFMSDGGTSNASVGRFAVGFMAGNMICVTGRRVDGGTRYVDYIGTAGNTGSFWSYGEEFNLTVTVDYTGKSFGDGSKCVWSVWKDDKLIYRQNVSSFNSGSINTTTAPANIGASTTPYGASIGGSVINSKYGKFNCGPSWSVWPSVLSDSEIISRNATSAAQNATSGISVISPQQGQPFQKNGSGVADISITGRYSGNPASISASFNGGPAQVIVASPSGGTFSGTLTAQSAGQGELRVWQTDQPSQYCIKRKVLVTDIYALIGQSNNTDRTDTGFGIATAKTYSMPAKNGPTVFNSRYAFGYWSDTSLCQNYIVKLGQNYYNKNGYPCAFIYAGIGGTNINKWQPNNTTDLYIPTSTDPDQSGVGLNLYNRAKQMVNLAAPGGVKGFLWHQGEADAGGSVTAAQETSQLQNIATALNTDFPGIPMVICKLQIIRTTSNVVIDASAVRNGQVAAWGSMSNILQGPDFSSLECDYQAAFGYFHLLNDTVMGKVSDGWFNQLVTLGLA